MLILQGCPQSKEGPKGKDAKSKRAHHKRPSRHLQADLFVFICIAATVHTCAGKAMSLKKAVACEQHTENNIVLTMHMGNAVTENTLLPLFAVGKSKEAYTAGHTPISQHNRVKTVLTLTPSSTPSPISFSRKYISR